MKVRWRWVDVEGQEGEEELDRAAVMQRTGLHARDLRILDPLLSYPSTILGRERAIVLNLEHLKAIITAEEVLLRNPAHEGVQRFVDDLLRRLHLQPAAGPPAAAPGAAAAAAVPGAAEAAIPGAASPGRIATAAHAPHLAAAAGGGVSGADGSASRHDSRSGDASKVHGGGGGREDHQGSEGTRESGSAVHGSDAARRADERRRVRATSEIEMAECDARERRGPVDGEGEEAEDEGEEEEEEEEDAWEGMGSAHGSRAESEPLTLRLRVKEGGGGKGMGLEAEGGEGGGGEREAKGWQHEEEEDEEDMEEYRPFEFIALEVALEQVCRALDSHTTLLENEAYPALDQLTSRVSSLNLDRVRSMKNRMSRLIARVQKVREELEQLLDDDDDMAEMFLTRMAAAPPSPTATSLHGAASLAFSLPAPAALHAPFATSPLGSRMSIGGRWGAMGMGMGAGGGGMAAVMSRASAYSSAHSDNDDIEELEQLLEVSSCWR
ncbi:unnamed protein product [Closterium sp. Yama58-4]|nr:unnamed protein product [Closterium sp. Yama58-4]